MLQDRQDRMRAYTDPHTPAQSSLTWTYSAWLSAGSIQLREQDKRDDYQHETACENTHTHTLSDPLS